MSEEITDAEMDRMEAEYRGFEWPSDSEVDRVQRLIHALRVARVTLRDIGEITTLTQMSRGGIDRRHSRPRRTGAGGGDPMSERLTDAELDAIEARHQPRGVDGDEDTAYEWGVWHDVERLVSEVRRLRDVLHIVAGFRPETEIERVLVQHAQDALHGDGDA